MVNLPKDFRRLRKNISFVKLIFSLQMYPPPSLIIARASNTLAEIGPAVVHGGFSTFLAFVFLAGSVSYVFSTFFKVSSFLGYGQSL